MAKWWLSFLIIEIIGGIILCTFFNFSKWILIILALTYIVGSCIIFKGRILGFIGYMIHGRTGNEQKAEKFYKLALKEKETIAYVPLSYGLILLRRGETQEALKLFEQVLERKGENLYIYRTALTNKALAYWQKGEIDKAIEILEECISKYDYINHNTYSSLGYLYIIKENYEKALEYTNKALEKEPKHAGSWDNLGQISYRKNDIKEAKNYFKKALSFKPDLVDSLYYLGIIAENEGNFEEAKEYFSSAMKCNITAFNTVTKKQVEEKYKKYTENLQ